MEYHQKQDGEWGDVTDGKFVACCDCGLVHWYEFTVVGDRILRRGYRENRKTADRRRNKEVKESIKHIAEVVK